MLNFLDTLRLRILHKKIAKKRQCVLFCVLFGIKDQICDILKHGKANSFNDIL